MYVHPLLVMIEPTATFCSSELVKTQQVPFFDRPRVFGLLRTASGPTHLPPVSWRRWFGQEDTPWKINIEPEDHRVEVVEGSKYLLRRCLWWV